MSSDYDELGASIQTFEDALRKAARGARFDVQVGDFRVIWMKRDGSWGLYVESLYGERKAEAVLVGSAPLGVRFVVAEGVDEIAEAALAAGDRQAHRCKDAIEAFRNAARFLDDKAS